jgi:CRISPR-associated endonuclease/helicase Cas3
MEFDAFFRKATEMEGWPEPSPFPFQRRLAMDEPLYELLGVPTGAGKTAAVVLAWLWRRRFADKAVRQATPRRLVYCLPMRVLVEQTTEAAKSWLRNLGLHEEVYVYVLMGGEEAEDWDMHPERDAILIGTQDMLLSRALNRGYSMSRYRWPMHFGLLNNDCLWVLDEVQLMGNGLATSTQLQAFREKLGTWGTVKTIWMSATLRPDWLGTVDFGGKVSSLRQLELSDDDRKMESLRKRLGAKKTLAPAGISAGDKPEEVAKIATLVKHQHRPGSLTLVVVNTVERSQNLYRALRHPAEQPLSRRRRRREKAVNQTASGDAQPDLLLIHSRFRPPDRQERNKRLTLADKVCRGESLPRLSSAEQDWIELIRQNGLIIVATQVIEAGVDISSKTLFTELAPWPSLVQRFGRCNRFGEYDDTQIFWIDVPINRRGLAAPYEEGELEAAREILTSGDLHDVGPTALAEYLETLPAETSDKLFPYEPTHVIRRKDILELFDATPDLAGNDIDISRFIRDDQELDVQVFWRAAGKEQPPSPDDDNGKAPRREELCAVPFYKFRDDFLKQGRDAYRWDALERRWTRADADAIIPGQMFLIPIDQGGYDPFTGWEPSSDRPVEPIRFEQPPLPEGNDDDLPSQDFWQTIAEHANDVVVETIEIASKLGLDDEWRQAVEIAARWHDRGKAHPIFQDAINDGRPGEIDRPELWRGRRDLAKAPKPFWKKSYLRKHFRHELATALAMLQADLSTLATYLAAVHHGKVRLSIRSLPDETRPADAGIRFARGIWDGDVLPETDLGSGTIAPAVALSLEPMELGIGHNGQPSWAERALRLRDDPQLGIFRLAFLEAVLRAADWRASDAHRRKRA